MKYSLAPLAGYTSAPLRLVCSRFGAHLTYTEMVSAAGLAHGSSPTRHLMETLPDEGPVVCQIFGSDPSELALAAREATALNRFAGIDLNAGCPMHKIVRAGAGAAMIHNPDHVHACLAAVKSATTLPVSLKTRPGPRPDRILLRELLHAAQSAGCSSITLHARFTSEMHGGSPHLDLLADLVSSSKIPVCGNGGVVSRETARLMAQTGVQSIMIGRAALARPWLFAELADPAWTETPSTPAETFRAQLSAAARFHAQLSAAYPADHVPTLDAYTTGLMRSQLFRYFSGRPGSKQLRFALNTAQTLHQALPLFAPFL